MPIYEFRCRECGSSFEELRPMADVGSVATAVTCPQGHDDVERLLSLIAPSSSSSSSSGAEPAGGGGACCASGCACGAN